MVSERYPRKQRVCLLLRNLMSLIHPRNAKRSLLAIAAALLISGAVFFGQVLAANVRANWSYDYGPMPSCSARRATNCIDHFEVLDISDRKKTVVIRFVDNPKPAVGKVDKISTDFKYGPPFGQRTLSVIAIGRDPHGVAVTSN